jgi:hypothetical protein
LAVPTKLVSTQAAKAIFLNIAESREDVDGNTCGLDGMENANRSQ